MDSCEKEDLMITLGKKKQTTGMAFDEFKQFQLLDDFILDLLTMLSISLPPNNSL